MQKKGRRKKKKNLQSNGKSCAQTFVPEVFRYGVKNRPLGSSPICSFLVRAAVHMFFFSQGCRPYVFFFFWLGVVLFNLCKQTTQLWFNLLPYCLLQGGCQFRDLRYGDRDRHNSVANVIGTKHKSTEGTNQSSEFEFELKFECSFSFFRCFVVSINSYGMDKNGRSLEL